MKRTIIRWTIFLSFLTCLLNGQTPPDPRLDQAQTLETQQRFTEALSLYEAILKDAPENKALSIKIAGLAYNLKQYGKAAHYYEILAPNGNPTVLYNLACSPSLSGEEKKALDYLDQAVQKGFNQLPLLKTDPDLAAIREHKRFKKIMKSVKTLENYPEAQKLDFWDGAWNVYNLQKTRVGESQVEKILEGAVILENWYGATGYQGKSFNHYHIDSGKWFQYWVDQGAGRIYFEGNWDEEQQALIFYEKETEGSGRPLRRLSFFKLSENQVRQFSELSSDAGKTWTVEYDFSYIRK